MQSLNFKYFYDAFIENHTIYGKKDAVNLLFYGSTGSDNLSQTTVSKMRSDEYSFSARSKPFKDYIRYTLETKVTYLRFLYLHSIPSSGSELCDQLLRDGFNLANDLFYELQSQSDIHIALITLLDSIMHSAATTEESAHPLSLDSMHCLLDSTLANVLSTNDTSISLDSLKEPLGWYIKMLCTHTKTNTIEIAHKSHMGRVKFMEKTSAGTRGKKPLFLSDIQGICTAMNTSLGNVLYCYEHRELIEKHPTLISALNNNNLPHTTSTVSADSDTASLINNPSKDPFKRWFGSYFCYFSSTDSNEIKDHRKRHGGKRCANGDSDLFELFSNDHIYSGILSISPAGSGNASHCSAHFRFMVNPEQPFIKEYDGIVTISLKKNAVFIELKSEQEAELAYIIFDDQFTLDVHCAIGQVLTISSRDLHHRPCSERIFISDTKIPPNSPLYQIVKANLMMHDKHIRIDEFGYSLVLDDLRKSGVDESIAIANKYVDLEALKSIGDVEIRKCAYISEGFFDLTHFTHTQNIAFETALRKHSIAPWTAKTNSKTAIKLLELIREGGNNSEK